MAIVNKVAQSALQTINLEDYYPQTAFFNFDIKDYLFQGLILKEKDFRSALKEFDWNQTADKTVLVYCSADAIVPVWAYMLIASYTASIATDTFCGIQNQYLEQYYRNTIAELDKTAYQDGLLVIKGCSKKPVPPAAYLELTKLLQPIAKSIMYGEPCSTVPIYKKPKKKT